MTAISENQNDIAYTVLSIKNLSDMIKAIRKERKELYGRKEKVKSSACGVFNVEIHIDKDGDKQIPSFTYVLA